MYEIPSNGFKPLYADPTNNRMDYDTHPDYQDDDYHVQQQPGQRLRNEFLQYEYVDEELPEEPVKEPTLDLDNVIPPHVNSIQVCTKTALP